MRLLAVVGTRPEAIKMAPVVRAARRRGLEVRLCATAQHREMLDEALALFGLVPDLDLDLMRPDQQLTDLAARALAALDAVLATERPDWLLVQGDTTTALAAALAGFHRRVAVGHVEAGLRSGDLERPFPEEMNRRLVDALSRALFAPTPGARSNLLREGFAPASVHVTGNTVVDALDSIRPSLGDPPPGVPRLRDGERLVVVTAHRRESFGPGMRSIAGAIARIAEAFPDVRVVYPVHPNPNVRAPMEEALGGRDRVHLIEPLAYPSFLRLLARAALVLSDSGGVQEEAPSLGVPALVLRERTERPEGVAAGAVKLVGVEEEAIVREASALLADPAAAAAMASGANPYGDGAAAERIVRILLGEPWEPFVPDAASREGG